MGDFAKSVDNRAIEGLTVAVEFLMCALREIAQGQSVAPMRKDGSAPGPQMHIEWAAAKIAEVVREGAQK